MLCPCEERVKYFTMKQFAKEIGAPDAFVADMSGKQMSKAVKAFCYAIGTT